MIFLWFLKVAICQAILEPCKVKQEQLKSFFSTFETYQWNMKDIFSGSYLDFSIEGGLSFFTLQKPIHQQYPPKFLLEGITKISAIKARTELNSKLWVNHFAFIEKTSSLVQIYYSESAQGDFKPPNFNQKIPIISDFDIQCFSIEYLNKDTFLLDCYNFYQQIQNHFIIANKSQDVIIVPNYYYDNKTIITKRITQLIEFVDQNEAVHQLLFRVIPAYATGQYLSNDSFIEIFSVSENQNISLFKFITAQDIGILINYPNPSKYQFSLISIQVFAEGNIYILTANDGIIILKLLQNFNLEFVERISLKDDAKMFDIGYQIQKDGSLKEVIAVIFNSTAELLENRVQKYLYKLDFVSTYSSLIQISKDLLIIQNKGYTYLINIFTQDLIHKEILEGVQGILVNKYYSELIAITQIDSRRYTLQDSKLRFQSGDQAFESKSFLKISALDKFNNCCQSTIIFKVLNQSDSQLYALQELELPDVYYDYPEFLTFKTLTSGPDINFNTNVQSQKQVISDNNIITVRIKTGGILRVQSLQQIIPLAKQVTFTKIISLNQDDSNFVFIIQESTTKNILVYICSTASFNKLEVDSLCISYQQLFVNVIINNQNFQCFFKEEVLFVIIVENKKTINMYAISQSNTIHERQFSYNTSFKFNITSISVIANNLYVVLEDQQVDVWNIYTTKKYSITKNLVQSLGFNGNWKVKKVLGNSLYHPSLLFIINNDNIIIADYQKEITIIKYLYYGDSQIDISVNFDTFFVIILQTNDQKIIEYDFTNYCNIFQMKVLPTYGYKMQTPLTISSNENSGFLYLIAFDSYISDFRVILCYKPRYPLRDSLIKIIKPKENLNLIKDTMISSSGYNNYIIYLNDGINHNFQWIDQFNQYQVVPEYFNTKWINKCRINITMNNFEQNNPISLSQSIVLFNTQTYIKILNVQQDIFAYKWSQSTINLNVSGPIQTSLIQCQQCGENKQIQIIEPIQLYQQENIENLNVVAQLVYDKYRLFLISNPKQQIVKLYNYQSIFIKDIVLSNDPKTLCDRFTMYNDYILITCKTESIYQILTIFCTNYETCGNHIAFSKFNDQVRNIQSIHYCRQLVISGSLSLNHLENDTFIQNCLVSINSTTYNVSIDCLKYQLYKEHIVKVYGGCNTFYFALSLTAEGTFIIHQGSDLSLTKTIALRKYITEMTQTSFYDFEPTQIINFSVHVANASLLFISESLSYKFTLIYNTQSSTLISFTYNYALSRYLDAKVIQALSIDQYNSQAAISFQYKDKVMICLYNLPNNSLSDQTIIGPQAQIAIDRNQAIINTIFYSISNNILMVPQIKSHNISEYMMSYYILDLRCTIIINDHSGLLYDQQISVTYSNFINFDTKVFNLKIIMNQNEDTQIESIQE